LFVLFLCSVNFSVCRCCIHIPITIRTGICTSANLHVVPLFHLYVPVKNRFFRQPI
jgi:hypothetical protein